MMDLRRTRLILVVVIALLAFPANLLATGQTPVSSETQLYIGHATHLTARIPAEWSPISTFPYVYGNDHGLFSATPIMASTIEEACQENTLSPGATITKTTWNDMPACEIRSPEPFLFGLPAVGLVLTHPKPFSYQGQTISYISVSATPEHFDDILRTISFDLSGLSGPEIAHSILDLAEAHSLYRDMVDWDELRATADGVQSPGDVSPFIERSVIRTLAQVGDNHSFLLPPFDSEEENPFFEGTPSGEMRVPLGYINVPSVIGAASQDAYITGAHTTIAGLESQACGWIIDLRENFGGTTPTMIYALLPLLPEGDLYGSVYPSGTESWFGRQGDMLVYTSDDMTTPLALDVDVPFPSIENPDAPIAVLVGPRTMSAAEWTTIALSGRDNTRSFGQPTAGLTTGQYGIAMLDGSTLMLTTNAAIDTDGNVYTGKLQPDEWVTSQSRGGDAQGNDGTIVAAEKWLLSQPACQDVATPQP